VSRQDITAYRDIVFARPVGFRPLPLDLYIPSAPPSTLCLYLHGGGWRVGSRSDGPGNSKAWSPSFFEEVAGLGLAIASVDYRLSGEAKYPAQQDDVSAAAAFLAEHGTDFGLSTSRVAVWGVSAGGQLAAMHALDPAADVRAAVCWYTPTDLDQLSVDVDAAGGTGDREADGREGLLIGAALDDEPALVRAASPVAHVGAAPPPFLFLHGTADTNVPPRQSSRLADAVTAAGGRATVELIDGGTHMFPELDDAGTREILERSVRFILDESTR
jgi:acetyl esterase/lipase